MVVRAKAIPNRLEFIHERRALMEDMPNTSRGFGKPPVLEPISLPRLTRGPSPADNRE